MTKTNKQRIAKYYLIIRGLNLNFDLFGPRYSPDEIRAINCAIAEVEAMIVELEKSYNEWNLTDLQNELTELKSML
jgi:hypothetical protein